MTPSISSGEVVGPGSPTAAVATGPRPGSGAALRGRGCTFGSGVAPTGMRADFVARPADFASVVIDAALGCSVATLPDPEAATVSLLGSAAFFVACRVGFAAGLRMLDVGFCLLGFATDGPAVSPP
ncbi:MAG: hypothetical protein WCH13_00545 [Deltaproteobacteria bacterium]